MELFDGDVTFQGSFNKIGFTEDGQKVTAGFKPPKGEHFVVLLLGTVKKGALDCNAEEMLNKLGFFRKDAAAHGDEVVQCAIKNLVAVARTIDKEAFAKGTQNVPHGNFRSLDYALQSYDAAMRAQGDGGPAERDAQNLTEAVDFLKRLNRSRSYRGMLNIMLDVREFLNRLNPGKGEDK